MSITAVIKDNKLIVTCDIDVHDSASGKSVIVASSRGNQATTAQHNGQPIVVGLNAYVKK